MFSLSSRSASLSSNTDSDEASSLPVLPWYVQVSIVGVTLFVLFGMQVGSQTPAATETASNSHQGLSQMHYISSQVAPDGEEIYNTRCMSCHQQDGQGVPGSFPPLTETEWVNGDKGRLIRLLLDGMTGEIEVNGTTYTGAMPPWGGALDDEEIAQVSTYIRTNFGNDSSPVTVEEVEKVREATADRSKPWTADELRDEANHGIPGDSTSAE